MYHTVRIAKLILNPVNQHCFARTRKVNRQGPLVLNFESLLQSPPVFLFLDMPTSTGLCADCQVNEHAIEVRRRRLCVPCFQKYVSSKILKRMETYRFKNQVGNTQKRLLLPISGGVSSLVLLEVLDRQIRKQLKQQGRTAYALTLCHVDVTLPSTDSTHGAEPAWWTRLRQQFDLHTFLPPATLGSICSHDAQLEQDLVHLGIVRRTEENETDEQLVTRVFSSARSATARADLSSLLLKRLIVSIAKQNSCSAVIWGHSDSKLAAKALAEVAKGRGAAVPSELADGPSPWDLDFNYPLRDLFEQELELHLNTLPEEVMACQKEGVDEVEAPVSLRATSIDALLSAYITGQGEKYPSIMANVVRTASKLQVPDLASGRKCSLCAMPMSGTSDDQNLCYGCQRMKQDIKV